VCLISALWGWERDNYKTSLFEAVEDSDLIDQEEVWRIGESVFGKRQRGK
jgi:hypothetical protein